MRAGNHAPLLIQWSGSSVRVYDPVTHESVTGPDIAECIGESKRGRDAVIAVAQRSSFVRSVPMPPVSADEVAKMLPIKVGPLLPLNAGEYVTGFRLARVQGGGQVAIVGAVKTDSLRRIYSAAASSGLNVRIVLPLAFGSWLAARARSLSDCAVVQQTEDSLNIDLIQHGELFYSRAAAPPESTAEVQEEISRTFSIAGVAPMPILALADSAVPSDAVESREALAFLMDVHALERQIFSFELPETVNKRRARAQNSTAQRAIAAALVAIALGGYAAWKRTQELDRYASEDSQIVADTNKQAPNEKAASVRKQNLDDSLTILDTAFEPAQTFSDVISVLGSHVSADTWFTGLSVGRGQPLIVRGLSTNGKVAAKYANELNKEDRFRGMKLLFATKSTIGKKSVEQFAVTGHVIGNLPIDRLLKAPAKAENPGAVKS